MPIHSLAYTDELERSLKFIRETLELTEDEKRRFFRSANTNLGESLLKSVVRLLSNDTLYKVYPHFAFLEVLPSDTVCFERLFCMKARLIFLTDHFGVVKAFLDAGLLPRVITGTSAGGLVASLVCTRTDEELKLLIVPELSAKITPCEEPLSVWIKRFWKSGARFDSVA